MITMSAGMRLLWNNKAKKEVPLVLKADYLDKGFVVVDDCVFFRQEWRKNLKHVNLDVVYSFCNDLTGYECSINKFHIEDYCEGYSNEDLANISFTFLEEFAELWRANFDFPCVAILSLQFVSIYDEDEIVPTAVFKFHKKREGEVWIEPETFTDTRECVLNNRGQ